jgi:Raf kinase inhibitor-like YbhB/YbcL family protein
MEKLRPDPLAGEGAARVLGPLGLVLLFILSGCLVPGEKRAARALGVSSQAFTPGGEIPRAYTCDGANTSPSLSWDGVPPGTESIAILVTDPDAPGGTFVHWVAYNIPPGTREIPEGAPGRTVLPPGSLQGMNDMGRTGYAGPCPPRGRPHHYQFTVYALDTTISPSRGQDGRAIQEAFTGHILARGELVGIYSRA